MKSTNTPNLSVPSRSADADTECSDNIDINSREYPDSPRLSEVELTGMPDCEAPEPIPISIPETLVRRRSIAQGLLTEQAQKKILSRLQKLKARQEKKLAASTPHFVIHMLRLTFSRTGSLMSLFCVALLLAAFLVRTLDPQQSESYFHNDDPTPRERSSLPTVRYIIEAGLALFFALLVNCIVVREQRLKCGEPLRLFSRFMSQYEEKGFEALVRDSSALDMLRCSYPPTATVRRGPKWHQLSHANLVEGDLVLLHCAVEDFPWAVQESDTDPGVFTMCETPLVSALERHFFDCEPHFSTNSASFSGSGSALNQNLSNESVPSLAKIGKKKKSGKSKKEVVNAKRPESVLQKTILHVKHVLNGLSGIGYLLVLAINLIRIFANNEKVKWVELALAQPAYMCILLLPFTLIPLSELTDIIGNSRLLALFKVLDEEREKREEHHEDHPSQEVSVDMEKRVKSRGLPFRLVWPHIWSLIRGSVSSLVRSTNPFQTLGSTTTLCCVDKEGMISEVLPIPRQIFLLKSHAEEQEEEEEENHFPADREVVGENEGSISLSPEFEPVEDHESFSNEQNGVQVDVPDHLSEISSASATPHAPPSLQPKPSVSFAPVQQSSDSTHQTEPQTHPNGELENKNENENFEHTEIVVDEIFEEEDNHPSIFDARSEEDMMINSPKTESAFLNLVKPRDNEAVLNVVYDPSEQHWFAFEQGQQFDENFMTLRVLGLNCLLNTPYSHPDPDLQHHRTSSTGNSGGENATGEQSASSVPPILGGGHPALAEGVPALEGEFLSLLGLALGFQDEALDQYQVIRRVHIVRPQTAPQSSYSSPSSPVLGGGVRGVSSYASNMELPNMPPAFQGIGPSASATHGGNVSVLKACVVQHEENGTQILTQGSLDLVLDYCSAYYDGESIQLMTPEVRERLKEVHKQWTDRLDMRCHAFSFKPLDFMQTRIIQTDLDSTSHRDFSSELSGERGGDLLNLPESSKKPAPLNRTPHQHPSIVRIFDPPANSGAAASGLGGMGTSRSGAFTELPEEWAPIFGSEGDSMSGVAHEEMIAKMMAAATQREEIYRKIQQGQIFIGMTASMRQVKPYLPNYVENLQTAGIRFVLFSSSNERKTKIVGERLGLEVDWNCCISLEDRDDAIEAMDESDLKACLPHGIDSIRRHIETKDDVPLLVSMFSDVTPPTTANMIRILQEHGEVVCCVGSAVNVHNLQLFATSDVAISAEPQASALQTSRSQYFPLQDSRDARGFTNCVSEMVSLPCAFRIKGENPFWPTFELIHEARTTFAKAKQCLTFATACKISISILFLLSIASVLPPVLTGIQILWLIAIIVPIMSSTSLLPSSFVDDGGVMSLMLPKNQLGKEAIRMWVSIILRFIASCVVCLAMFSWTLYSLDSDLSWHNVWGSTFDPSSDMHQSALTFAQVVMMWFLVYYLCFHNLSFIHRTISLRKFNFKKCKWIIVWLLVCLALQTVFSVVSIASATIDFSWPSSTFPSYVYAFGFLWPIGILVIDEQAKKLERDISTKEQKRMRLAFGTKLGMHSPV